MGMVGRLKSLKVKPRATYVSFVVVLFLLLTVAAGPPDPRRHHSTVIMEASEGAGATSLQANGTSSGGVTVAPPGGATIQDIIICAGHSFITKYSSPPISSVADTICDGDVAILLVVDELERRRGIWPFYWWQTDGRDTDDCVDPNCNAVSAGGLYIDLVAGKYRTSGTHYITWPPGYSGPSLDYTEDCCVDLP